MERYIGEGARFILSGSDLAFMMAGAQARPASCAGSIAPPPRRRWTSSPLARREGVRPDRAGGRSPARATRLDFVPNDCILQTVAFSVRSRVVGDGSAADLAGHLRLALVSCPVALYSARHERETIRFNMINPRPAAASRWSRRTRRPAKRCRARDTVKGYEYSKGQYVIITDEDLESVRVESSGLMKVEKFVDAASIDPIYYDASYYLAPDGKGSEDVYAVLREAISGPGKVALTRVVISQRERTIALRPMDGGLVAHTLNEQRDLNAAERAVRATSREREARSGDGQLATQLVERQSEQYDPADLEDRYETRLRAMLEAKIKGEGHAERSAAPSEAT